MKRGCENLNELSELLAFAMSSAAFAPSFQPLEQNLPRVGSRLNALNRPVSVFSANSVVENSYDLLGRVTNRANIVYPGGLSVSYEYDEENRLKEVIANHANLTNQFSFGYDGASRLTNIVYPNGVSGDYEYDAESRITGYSYTSSGSNFVQRSIVRDARGFKTSENIISGLEPEMIEGEQRHEHNAADQLTHIDQRDTWLGSQLEQWYNRKYFYNDNGCLTLERVDRNLWNTNAAIDEYTVDYEWDHDNRLARSEKTVLVPHDEIDGMTGAVMNRTYTDGPSTSTEYLYDASGVRIARIHNSVTNHFVIDYNAPLKMPLAETDASGNITRYYIWSSHGLLAHLDVNPSTGAITQTRYYHSDEQSSTLALTDENGTVTDQFAYTPYGVATHTGSSDTPYKWLGGIAVRAEGNKLYYMLNRTYSASMRRFISPDPSGIDGGANLYAYAGLNPLFYADPFGLEKTSAVGRGMDWLQGGLDVAGMAPAVGIIADALNTAISLGRGNWADAGLSAAAMIPIVGQGATAGKWIKNSLKYSDEAASGLKSLSKSSFSAHKRALKKVHGEVGSLPKGRAGKFGSPQAGTARKGYRLDPSHPNAKAGTPETGKHFNWWDYTGGKKGAGGRYGSIPIGD